MSLLNLIRDYLLAQSVGDSTNWPMYIGYMPDDKDQTIALFETGGYPADTLQRENRRVSFQVRIRGKRQDYGVVRSKWDEAFVALQDAQETLSSPPLLEGVVFIQALSVGPMQFTDEKSRPNMTSNWQVLWLA